MFTWLDLPRIPEPEVMDDSGEVDAYAGASAKRHLGKIDDSFVEHVLRLLAPRGSAPGRALDIGSGPGQIIQKLSERLPEWEFIGVDRSPAMLARARTHRSRAEFLFADGCRLPFADRSFDLVICNSVLHHLEHPARLFEEIARVADCKAAILLRDLRRPSRAAHALHVRWHGRAYSGLMYKLYCDSVRAAYTAGELARMLHAAPVPGARIFTRGRTHLGLARAAAP